MPQLNVKYPFVESSWKNFYPLEENVTIYYKQDDSINSYVVKVCVDSVRNPNTGLWTKTERFEYGSAGRPLRTISDVLTLLVNKKLVSPSRYGSYIDTSDDNS